MSLALDIQTKLLQVSKLWHDACSFIIGQRFSVHNKHDLVPAASGTYVHVPHAIISPELQPADFNLLLEITTVSSLPAVQIGILHILPSYLTPIGSH